MGLGEEIVIKIRVIAIEKYKKKTTKKKKKKTQI